MLPLPSFASSEFTRALRLGLALVCVALASGCGTTQSALPFVPANEPLHYSTYLNGRGQLRGEDWALALMGHPAHREQVFLQAQQGLFPGSDTWSELEGICRSAGRLLAQEHARPACTVLPAEAGCEFNWNPVRSLLPGAGPGRERLLDIYKEGYDARWAQLQRGFHAQTELVRAGTLMAGATLGRTPAAAEARALSAETRALAAETEAAGTRAARLLSAEALGLSRTLSADEASALEARLLELEVESTGAREAFSAQELRSGSLAPKPRPADLAAEDALRWDEFEAYRQRRFQEVRSQPLGAKGSLSVKPPLRWEDYRQLRNHFQSCYEFESKVGGILLQELEQPAGSHRLLTGSRQPLLARHVGTTKTGQQGVRFPDYLAVDETTLDEGSTPRVETISVKKRNFSRMSQPDVERTVRTDLQEARNHYGGRLEVRRSGHPLYGRTVQISKIHLVYAAESVGSWKDLIKGLCDEVKVEVHFE